MSYIADPFLVVLDANVLYPFRVRDVLLTFAKAGLFRARLTDQIVEEWSRSLLARRPELEPSVRSQEAAIRSGFEECFVTGYGPLIPGLELPDPDDRHVLAAAIKCSAQHIVTENTKDFPAETLADYDITTIDADTFLANTFALHRPHAMRALSELRQRYKNPSMNVSEFLLDLTKSGMPKLAASVRETL